MVRQLWIILLIACAMTESIFSRTNSMNLKKDLVTMQHMYDLWLGV